MRAFGWVITCLLALGGCREVGRAGGGTLAAAPSPGKAAGTQHPRGKATASDSAPVAAGLASRSSSDTADVFLVWSRRDGRPPVDTTLFIRADGSVASRRPGIHVGSGTQVYRFQTETRHHPPTDCGDERTPYYARETIERALLSSAGAKLILDDLPDEDERPARQQEILVATLGPYLFLRREVVDFVCGMHPSLGSEFLVLEVAAGSIRSIDRSRWGEGAEAALPGALAIMSREREGSLIVGRPLERSDLSVTMAFPRLNASGVEWIAQVTEPASYGSSDGTWAAYMRSAEVPVPQLPSEFRAAARIPEPVLRRLAKLPAKHHARGMSWIAHER